jgi:hypothetical protein
MGSRGQVAPRRKHVISINAGGTEPAVFTAKRGLRGCDRKATHSFETETFKGPPRVPPSDNSTGFVSGSVG